MRKPGRLPAAPPAPQPAPPAPQPVPPTAAAPANPFAGFDAPPPAPAPVVPVPVVPAPIPVEEPAPEEVPAKATRGRRDAPPSGTPKALLYGLAAYPLLATAPAVYRLFVKSGDKLDPGHPLST